MSHTTLFSADEKGWFNRFDPQTIHAFVNTLNEMRVKEGDLSFEDVQTVHDTYFTGSNKIKEEMLQKIYTEIKNSPRTGKGGTIPDDIIIDPPIKHDDDLMVDAGIDMVAHMDSYAGKEPPMFDELSGPGDDGFPEPGAGGTAKGGYEPAGPREPGSDGPTS